ncbi:hypothetical protein NIES2104_56200 [Leptolyngbya sp. NIES-2104]|nr:hypothetical protein NIES2104_56200 [Leptolyngbya sp. NIES-2104]
MLAPILCDRISWKPTNESYRFTVSNLHRSFAIGLVGNQTIKAGIEPTYLAPILCDRISWKSPCPKPKHLPIRILAPILCDRISWK